MRKGKSSKDDADKKNHIWPFLAILVALLGLAWSQMPGFFNKRIDIPRNTAQSEYIEGDANIAAQIHTTLVDGTPISELGSRITMSSTLIENSEWYKDGHIIVASPAGENFKYKCGEVDITCADRVFLTSM